ncbi:MAG TPA: sugar phosphate isomerase/epimerase [Phycisphaerae bacterium]|nr:sugar phosphate isomerase/epimerase [Phycisphaerae bacterium]HRY69349.1 sugar phosphate isomerase/epimerase [Phycisphaerae bacterium]HSA26216.1 sugar phosphate isomerase/epimerase [Phycisphaerae bacterium]
MGIELTRRQVLAGGAVGGAFAVVPGVAVAESEGDRSAGGAPREYRISLNTSTLRGHKLPIAQIVDIAARAGYGGIEPWVDELDRHVEGGGSLSDLAKQLKDRGLAVTGAIAFFEWMVDDEGKRSRAFEEAKRRMGQLARIGGLHLAAPPLGDVKNVDPLRAAKRYRELLELGEREGVPPALEIWGAAGFLHRLGQAMLVALEAHHPKATVLADVYHLYKGGSALSSIRLVNPAILGGFHLNDYPADPPREKIGDKDRVYPGDGVAPLKQLFRDLGAIGYPGPLSIELFNPEYYRQDPAVVARTALEKTRAVMLAA